MMHLVFRMWDSAKYFLLAAGLSLLSSCYFGRSMTLLAPDLKDIKRFPFNTIEAADIPFRFHYANQFEPLGDYEVRRRNDSISKFQDVLDLGDTRAFILIRNDTVLYEWYHRKSRRDSRFASFSVSKSYVSALVGIAIGERKIGGLDDPITRYIPELLVNDKRFSKVSIRHLIDMTDGFRIKGGNGNPWGDVARLYYGKNLWNQFMRIKIEKEPGKRWAYNNINTALLGLIVSRASGMSLSDYMEQKIWKRIGTEYDLTWTVDNKTDRMEKAFCCLGARAIDYAKLGRLYLHDGYWEGEEILPRGWVEETICQDSCKVVEKQYQHHWWPNMEEGQYFEANGHLGQVIQVHPLKNIIMVRTGTARGKNVRWYKVMEDLAAKL